MMLAEKLAAMGRNGDSRLAHVTEDELVLPPGFFSEYPEILAAVKTAMAKTGVDWRQYQVGGGDDSVNPATGLPEFAWDDDGDGLGTNGGDSGGTGGNSGVSVDSGGGSDYSSLGRGDAFQDGPDNMSTQTERAQFGDNYGNGNGGGQYNYDPETRAFNYQDNFGPPTEPLGGNLSFMGFSPASRTNPISGQVQNGFGFNPGRAIGGMAGMALGPLGGLAGSLVGGKMADTRFSFGRPGYGGPPAPAAPQERQGDASTLAELLMMARR